MGHLGFFCLLWITCLSILIIRLNLTYCLKFFLLLAFCLCHWSNSNVFFIRLTIRAISRDHIQYERLKGGTLEPWINSSIIPHFLHHLQLPLRSVWFFVFQFLCKETWSVLLILWSVLLMFYLVYVARMY